MKRLLILLVLVAAPAPTAWSICDLPPPPPPPSWDMPTPEGGPIPTPTPGETTPGPRPGTPGGNSPRGARTRGAGADFSGSWHLWWELNREHLLGLRRTLRDRDVTSGGRVAGDDGQRDRVLTTLRQVATASGQASLRGVALRALGRAGEDQDASLFLGILRSSKQPAEVVRGAAIGLGCLRPIQDTKLRAKVRAFFVELLEGHGLSGQDRLLTIMALSIRARNDSALGVALAQRVMRPVRSGNEAAALLYACGIARDRRLAPVLLEAVRSGLFGNKKLHDVARSHAALGLGMSGEPAAVTTLARVLTSRRASVHTRRSAALALGHLLRGELDARRISEARKALIRTLEKSHDPLARGYAAVAMGTAREPFGLELLRKVAHAKSDAVARPYAALALGLAARHPTRERRFLLEELARARDPQAAAALCIAAGVSRMAEAREPLMDRLMAKRLNAAVRGPAIQGFGLLGQPNARIERTLVAALDDGNDEVVEDACIALGLLGTRTTGKLLVAKLGTTKSEPVQAHMVVALSHLGGTATVDPLLDLLADRSKKHTMRESAAAALGILVDDRENDPMFEIDAFTNPYALTVASRELVLAY